MLMVYKSSHQAGPGYAGGDFKTNVVVTSAPGVISLRRMESGWDTTGSLIQPIEWDAMLRIGKCDDKPGQIKHPSVTLRCTAAAVTRVTGEIAIRSRSSAARSKENRPASTRIGVDTV